jgi:hypothetical protein
MAHKVPKWLSEMGVHVPYVVTKRSRDGTFKVGDRIRSNP